MAQAAQTAMILEALKRYTMLIVEAKGLAKIPADTSVVPAMIQEAMEFIQDELKKHRKPDGMIAFTQEVAQAILRSVLEKSLSYLPKPEAANG